MREIKHLSVHPWLRSAIPESQQPTFPIGFLFLKLPPPPCAVLLVHRSTYTHTKALHTRLYTQSFYTQTLLRIEACSQSRVYTEQLLHTAAFTQREAFAQSSLYNLIHTETLNTQMPKLLHRRVFTHRGMYTRVLHTDAADASTHRSF